MDLTTQDKHQLFNKLDSIEHRISKVERGLYGDPDNALPGVINDMKDIKKFKGTMTKVGGTVSTIVTLALNAFIALFRN